MERLSDQAALVTGGASGLGKAIAQRLAADGANVVITDIEPDLGRSTAAECGFTFLEHDVCDEARWIQVVQEVEGRYGQLRILVNNAGVVSSMAAINPENTRLEDWRRIFAVNVEGVFLGCRTAIAAMRRGRGGSIINISSIAGLVATPDATAYGASKAAVRQLTKSVAQYCAHERLNIRCNSVHPGIVRTTLWNKSAAEIARIRRISIEEFVEETRAIIPMGDFTLPEDVAGVVSFLASADARHVTGAQLVVDGGIVDCDTYRARESSAADRCYSTRREES